jgi:hypothetical protein
MELAPRERVEGHVRVPPLEALKRIDRRKAGRTVGDRALPERFKHARGRRWICVTNYGSRDPAELGNRLALILNTYHLARVLKKARQLHGKDVYLPDRALEGCY